MTPAQFQALRRAWWRKTRRPVPGAAVTAHADFFDDPYAETLSQAAFAKATGKFK